MKLSLEKWPMGQWELFYKITNAKGHTVIIVKTEHKKQEH